MKQSYSLNLLDIFYYLKELLNNFSHPFYMQDHNTDYIVKFPDWDPSANTRSYVHQQNQMQKLVGIGRNRRAMLEEAGSSLPKPHLWYNTLDAITALKLFLDAGNELSGSLTYR